jgi:hypothetical protein
MTRIVAKWWGLASRSRRAHSRSMRNPTSPGTYHRRKEGNLFLTRWDPSAPQRLVKKDFISWWLRRHNLMKHNPIWTTSPARKSRRILHLAILPSGTLFFATGTFLSDTKRREGIGTCDRRIIYLSVTKAAKLKIRLFKTIYLDWKPYSSYCALRHWLKSHSEIYPSGPQNTSTQPSGPSGPARNYPDTA